ncbi:YcxB-like protein [Pseudobutyrivibrio sp. YE44]|uniref:YcxB family protein n=1 Tax=Pseudobutyrivibrio sp. YE44 TaxID=1520802 RepID=UPI0008900ED3|nr:YcxB family protein [Pseudobutyrivibrio sp. YE44]SDB42618.1 YcxB-like protein [Pseudobutyrivibrio sp. YE44]
MENISFDIKIKEEDLYKFNLHHAYRSSQGIVSILLGVLLLAIWALRLSTLSMIYKCLYPVFALVIMVYIPMSLKLRVKNQMTQEVFMHPLHYELTERGLVISSPTTDEPAELPWEYIYKVSTWKKYLLIYSNRVNAYIIPKEDIIDVYEPAVAYIKNHVEDYKIQIK